MGRKQNRKPACKMHTKGKKKRRPVQTQSCQKKQLPSYSSIVKYFFQYGEIKHYKKGTRAYIDAPEYIIKSRHSLPNSSIVYEVFNKYRGLNPIQIKFSADNNYFIDTLLLDKLKEKGSYFEFVGVAYFSGEWSLKHFNSTRSYVPGLIKQKKDIKDLEETLTIVGV